MNKTIENFWKEPKHLTNEQYQGLLQNPPKHYCKDICNCVDNPKDCRAGQCDECRAIAGETRATNLRLDKAKKA